MTAPEVRQPQPAQLQGGPTSVFAAQAHQARFLGQPVQRCGLCKVALFFQDLNQKLFDKYVCLECFMKPGRTIQEDAR